jgi:hypothetical protein
MAKKSVDIGGGITVELEEADADKAIAARQALKTQAAAAVQERDALLVKSQEALAAAAKAAEDLRLSKLSEAQRLDEIEKARKAETAARFNELAAQVDTYQSIAVEDRLRAHVLAHPDIVADPVAIDDLVARLKGSCKFDPKTKTVVVSDGKGGVKTRDDGTVINVDAFVSEAIEARPSLRKSSAARGSGGTGQGANRAGVAKMSPMEYSRSMQSAPQSIAAINAKIAAGTLVISD